MSKLMLVITSVLDFVLFVGSILLLGTLVWAAAFYPTLYTDAYNVFISIHDWFGGL